MSAELEYGSKINRLQDFGDTAPKRDKLLLFFFKLTPTWMKV